MAHDKKWQVGDTVKLASGGPAMTVEGLSEHDPEEVHCVWFHNDEVKRSAFPHAALIAYVRSG